MSEGRTKLNGVRLAFANVFQAKSFQADQDARFSALFLMDKDGENHKECSAAIKAAIESKWKDKPRALKICLRPGEEKEDYAGFDDTQVFISTGSKTRPTVVDRRRQPLAQEDGVIYSGCYVNAFVRFWAQDNQYGRRVNAELLGVQFLRDGEPFTGGGQAADPDDFDDLGSDTEERVDEDLLG